jgi:gamma-glutamylcyclotransferase
MYYFAYGSYLDRKQMLERCPDSKPKFSATLPNYQLVFLGWSRQWHGGTASIRPARGEKVRGGVYEISERCLSKLDAAEGYPAVYNRINVNVFDEDGNVAQAVTYIRSGKQDETKPSPEYLTSLQKGYREWGLV